MPSNWAQTEPHKLKSPTSIGCALPGGPRPLVLRNNVRPPGNHAPDRPPRSAASMRIQVVVENVVDEPYEAVTFVSRNSHPVPRRDSLRLCFICLSVPDSFPGKPRGLGLSAKCRHAAAMNFTKMLLSCGPVHGSFGMLITTHDLWSGHFPS